MNDKLNLKYDKFDSAILMIEFNTPNDTKEDQMRIIQITISVNYEERKEDKHKTQSRNFNILSYQRRE